MRKYFFIFLLIFGCNNQKLNWFEGSLEDAFLINTNQIIMIDFYTDWCSPCKILDSDTVSSIDKSYYIK